MAAIIESHRFTDVPAPRPALRLVTLDGCQSAPLLVDLGFRASHLAAAVVALVVVLVGALALGNGAFASLAPEAPAAAPAVAAGASAAPTVLVQPGDTLWSIARRIQPTGDVRPLVDQLVAANGSAVLVPGATVIVPA